MFQVGSACYSTPTAALSATVSAQAGTVVVDGGVAKVLTVAAVGDSSVTYTLTPLSGGASTSAVVSITPQPCGLLTAADGLQLGWMVAGAWIAVYALLFITRAFRGETVDNYGNA